VDAPEAPATRGAQVHVTIDRLVLRGVTGDRRDALVSALTTELRRRLTAPGAAQALGPSRQRAAIAAGPVSRAPSGSAAALGRSFAGALAAGLAEQAP
jgi:hypothetical protein